MKYIFYTAYFFLNSAYCPPFINIDFDFVLFLADDANRIFGETFNKCASFKMQSTE